MLTLFLLAIVTAERPNVVLIMADDVGRECFGCYGSTQYSTPNIDRLAAAGVRFDNCHSQPLCTPSRVKLVTGRGNHENYVAFSVFPRDEPTVGDLMHSAGYATGVCGKWQLLGAKHYPERFAGKGVRPGEAGFDTHCLWQIEAKPKRYWSPGLEIDGTLRQFGKDVYGPDVVSDWAIDFVRQHREGPFFLYYPMILVHDPFLPTPDSPAGRSRSKPGKDKQANFEDMVATMDKLVGRLADELETLGIAENTLLLFVGDNGTHRTITSRLGGREIVGGKGLTKNRGTHVPLIASWPGRARSGSNAAGVRESLVDFTDFLPTLAEVADADVPAGCEGVSLLPQILDEDGPVREVTTCYYWPRPERGRPQRYAFDGRFKLHADGRYFDTRADPEEERPLDAEPPAKLREAIGSLPERGERILDLPAG